MSVVWSIEVISNVDVIAGDEETGAVADSDTAGDGDSEEAKVEAEGDSVGIAEEGKRDVDCGSVVTASDVDGSADIEVKPEVEIMFRDDVSVRCNVDIDIDNIAEEILLEI